MHNLAKFMGKMNPMLVGRFTVIALALLVLPALLWNVSGKANLQSENADWANYARDFIRVSNEADMLPIAAMKSFDLSSVQTFTPAHIEIAMNDAAQLDCLSTAIYYEARSEAVAGQLAVAQVILNRVDSKYYPSTVCDVVYQGSTRKTGCQFSFTCDGSLSIRPRVKAWARSRKAAVNAMLGMNDITIGRATHYHTVSINPKWSSTLLRTANVGSHVFYRFPNRREKAVMAKDI